MKTVDLVGSDSVLVGSFDCVFDRCLVVQDHLGFGSIFSSRLLSEFDQPLGLQQRVSISLKPARVPGKINQEAVQYISSVCAGRAVDSFHAPDRC